MKKKILVCIIVLGVCCLPLFENKDDNMSITKEEMTKETKNIAFFQKEETGDYKKVTTIPSSGYALNETKSTCSNNTLPSWNNGSLILRNLNGKDTSCYLYFDKIIGQTTNDIISSLNATTQTDSVPNFANAATTNEGVFKTSDGMYGGDTYYWRGAVENNHVIFADLCWKIIRINGDGSIRMIYNGAPENGVCKQVSDETSIAVDGQTYNESYNYSYYVGWTYGTGQRPDNNLAATPSNIKVQIDTWYKNNITDKGFDGNVATGKFCNDRNTKTDQNWSASGSTFYYAAYERLADNKKPVTTCPEGDVYEMKAGAITADEVSMAGGAYRTANSSYYLYNGQYYWTMSPYGYDSSSAPTLVFQVWDGGRLWYNNIGGTTTRIRPVINLLPSTTFKLGTNGTASSPYEVM